MINRATTREGGRGKITAKKTVMPMQRSPKKLAVKHVHTPAVSSTHREFSVGPIAQHEIDYSVLNLSSSSPSAPEVARKPTAPLSLRMRRRHMRRIYALRALIALVLILPLAAWGYFHSSIYANASEQRELKRIIAQVADAVVVPRGASPEIYKVSDPKKLAAQGLQYAGISKGDRVLYYKKSNLIVFYGSSEKKIISVVRSQAGAGAGAVTEK